MNWVELFHSGHQLAEFAGGLILVYAGLYAIKNFKIALWRRGGHLIFIGALMFVGHESLDMVELFAPGAKMASWLIFTMHIMGMLAAILIAAGIFSVVKSVGKIIGARKGD
jgi:hypothetical protein